MTRKEFEDYMVDLSEDQYDALIQDRIARLNPAQKEIAIKREAIRKERAKLLNKASACQNEDERQHIFDCALDLDSGMECEHGRHIVKFCNECIELENTMFPEFVDEDGNYIE